jgi:hypothetical protein
MAAPQQPAMEKPALSAEASVLAPGVKVPEHATGYLLTLRETVRCGDARATTMPSPLGVLCACVFAEPHRTRALRRTRGGR